MGLKLFHIVNRAPYGNVHVHSNRAPYGNVHVHSNTTYEYILYKKERIRTVTNGKTYLIWYLSANTATVGKLTENCIHSRQQETRILPGINCFYFRLERGSTTCHIG